MAEEKSKLELARLEADLESAIQSWITPEKEKEISSVALDLWRGDLKDSYPSFAAFPKAVLEGSFHNDMASHNNTAMIDLIERVQKLRSGTGAGVPIPKSNRRGRKTDLYVAKRNEEMSKLKAEGKSTEDIAEALDKQPWGDDEYIKDHDRWLKRIWTQLQDADPSNNSLKTSPSYSKAISYQWVLEKFKRLISESSKA